MQQGRKIIRAGERRFAPYDLEGPVQPEFGFASLSYDAPGAQGTFIMRMAPGSASIAHEHRSYEDYLILEGELIEDDGTILRPGDLVSYAPGTRHNSRTETGCLVLVCEWRPAPLPG